MPLLHSAPRNVAAAVVVGEGRESIGSEEKRGGGEREGEELETETTRWSPIPRCSSPPLCLPPLGPLEEGEMRQPEEGRRAISGGGVALRG